MKTRESDESIERGFLLMRRFSRESYDHWFHECRLRRQPFVVVTRGRRWAKIDACPEAVISEFGLQDLKPQTVEQMRNLLPSRSRRYKLEWSDTDIAFAGIPSEVAEEVATALTKLLTPDAAALQHWYARMCQLDSSFARFWSRDLAASPKFRSWAQAAGLPSEVS